MVKKPKQEEVEIELEEELEEEIELEEEEEEEEKPKPKKMKAPEVKVSDLKVGDVYKDLHGEDFKITKKILTQMKAFKKTKPKSHVVWKNKITGTFLHYKDLEDNPRPVKAPKASKPKAKEVEIEIEDELEEMKEAVEQNKLDELIEVEDELSEEEKDMVAIEDDYRVEYNIKPGNKINRNTKKFKAFVKNWNNK